MADGRNIFSLKWTVVFSLAAKFALLLVGVAIIGIASTRTELSACGIIELRISHLFCPIRKSGSLL